MQLPSCLSILVGHSCQHILPTAGDVITTVVHQRAAVHLHAHLWHGQYVKQQNPSLLLCANQQSVDHLLSQLLTPIHSCGYPLAGGVLAFSANQKRKQAALVFLFVQYHHFGLRIVLYRWNRSLPSSPLPTCSTILWYWAMLLHLPVTFWSWGCG